MNESKLTKIFIILAVNILAFPFYVSGVFAQNVNYQIPNPSRFNSLEEIINALTSLIVPVFMLTFGAMVLFGAFTLLTSQGNEEKIESSKKIITAAIIGFVIAVFAPTIVNLVTGLLGVDGLNILT